MEYWSQALSVLGLLAVVLLVLVSAYFFTRWAGKNLGGGLIGALGGSGRMEVLDRATLSRDQSLLVVRAGERYLLLGCTPTGLTLLTELTREEGENWIPPVPPRDPVGKRTPDFRALMQRLREKK